MTDILMKMNELVQTCETRIKKLEAEKAELAIARREIKELSEKNNALLKELNEREAVVRKLEKKHAGISDATALLKEQDEKKKKLNFDIAKFEEYKEKETKRIQEAKESLDHRKAKIDKQEEETRKKAENYRQEIANAMMKKTLGE